MKKDYKPVFVIGEWRVIRLLEIYGYQSIGRGQG